MQENYKILVVDDDMRLRALLERYLTEQGFQVRSVANAEQMDRLLTRESFHLMVLDLMLPGEDGLSICRRLRSQSNPMPIIMVTAKVELGGENYDIIAKFNGKPASGLGIKLATGANALDTATAIRAELKKMEPFFPSGLKIVYPYDTTPFVKISIHEVVKTLVEAIILVFLVMYLFLQNFRATLIPTIAVPVVLLGTFAILSIFGYSINTLTMFGMVLAIGLLVDDAIVVVENVERVMAEEGLPTICTP
jgi:Cu/Ag efflux pump CusA